MDGVLNQKEYSHAHSLPNALLLLSTGHTIHPTNQNRCRGDAEMVRL